MPRIFVPVLLLIVSTSLWAQSEAKAENPTRQRLVVRLEEPLRKEVVKVRVLEARTASGEVKELEATLDLAPERRETTSSKVEVGRRPSLDIDQGTPGGVVQVFLPKESRIELTLRDFYGKQLAVLMEGRQEAGHYSFPVQDHRPKDNTGVVFATLRIEGKLVQRKMIYSVR